MVQDLYNFKGANRRNWNPVDGTMTFNIDPSLDLALTHSAVPSICNAKSATAFSTLTSGRELNSSLLDSSMDFSLHLGYKKTQNEAHSGKVDLELSLSIGAAESDVTSITHASSPVPTSLAQLVDEGSTSSKWRGLLLPPLNPLPNLNTPIILDPYSNIKDPFPSAVPTPSPNEGRKASVKTCQYPGCTKGARGASGRCISHGGGRRCQRPGCHKGAEGRTVFCKAHGGGRRCNYLGCTKSAEGRTDFCIAHGGGRRCNFEACPRAARGRSGFCIRHGGGKRCKVENCTKSAEGLTGHCIAHGGGRRCQYPDCPKGAQGSTKYCKAHGGGKRCTFLGCNKGAEGSTQFCKGHGGGKRCTFEQGCTKSVHGGTLFCVAHGGGKRCGIPDCTRSARGKTSFCVRHGGGKRCQSQGCPKSAQGSTDFCKAHGGGRRCLWGQPGSQFGADGGTLPCDKFARGKIGLCAAHSAEMQDKCVHGENTTFRYMMQSSDSVVSKKGKEIAVAVESGLFKEGNLPGFVGNEHYLMSMNVLTNRNLVIPEGRVHGGGLMAMLRENLVSFEPSVGSLTTGEPSQVPVARNWV